MKKEIKDRNNKLWEQAYANLFLLYGEDPPVECLHRLVAEKSLLRDTDAIQCFATLGKLCTIAREQSVPVVASTVNSSFAAWLMGATMVNPLLPHYRCPVCGKIEFVSTVRNGFDLPAKKCSCGKELIRDGHDIPHQSFTNYLKNGIDTTIYTPKYFKPTAICILQEVYAGFAEILPVRFNTDDPLPYVQYVARPLEKEKPAVSADGYWDTDWETFEHWHSGETRFFIYSDEQIEQLYQQQLRTGIPTPDMQALLNSVLAEALSKSKYQTLLEKSEHLPLQESVSFDLLLRIDGLFCAVDVWRDKTIGLLQSGQADFWDIPVFREDVFQAISNAVAKYDIHDPSLALLVMDNVRNGRYSRKPMPRGVEALLGKLGLQDWYIDLLKEVSFLCHKGHCATHLIVDLMCEWYSTQAKQIARTSVSFV